MERVVAPSPVGSCRRCSHDTAESRALDEWNRTATPFDSAAGARLVAQQAARTPQPVAVSPAGHRQLGYTELDSRANRLARLLRTRGIGRGSLVGICIERGIDMVVAQLACPEGRRGVRAAGSCISDRAPRLHGGRCAARAAADRIVARPCDRAGRVNARYCSISMRWRSRRKLTRHCRPTLRSIASPDDAAYVIYTSGSTGKPKGVVVPHRAVANFLASMAREPGLDPGRSLARRDDTELRHRGARAAAAARGRCPRGARRSRPGARWSCARAR